MEQVHQIGDVTINEQTDLTYVQDGDNAALVEKKTTVAQVPLEDGTTAVLAGVEYNVRATEQPKEQELGELAWLGADMLVKITTVSPAAT